VTVSTDPSTPVDYLLREVARLGEKNRRLQRQVRALRESRDAWKRNAQKAHRTLPLDDSRHGTLNGYTNHGCRCDRCRQANTDACRAYKHRTGRNQPYAEWLATVEGCHAPHGTETRYVGGGCRCPECKQASAAARRHRRAQLSPEERERIRAYDRLRRQKVKR
jgi:hypothetical protein